MALSYFPPRPLYRKSLRLRNHLGEEEEGEQGRVPWAWSLDPGRPCRICLHHHHCTHNQGEQWAGQTGEEGDRLGDRDINNVL